MVAHRWTSLTRPALYIIQPTMPTPEPGYRAANGVVANTLDGFDKSNARTPVTELTAYTAVFALSQRAQLGSRLEKRKLS